MNHSSSNPPFFVGEEVVCIKSAKNDYGRVVKGKHYFVDEIRQCKCGKWIVYVGLFPQKKSSVYVRCSCGNRWRHKGKLGVNAKLFAPIISKSIYADATEQILKDFPLEVGGVQDVPQKTVSTRNIPQTIDNK